MHNFLLLASAAALATQCIAKAVSPEALEALIHIDDLVAGAQQLQKFAYAYPERNRVFGGRAHNDTVTFLYNALVATDYYNVELQEFVELYAGGNATLKINGNVQHPTVFGYSPGVSVSASLVSADTGCDASDYPSEASGNVVLIARGGDCYNFEKALLAKSAGAKAAIIYNNKPGPFPDETFEGKDNYAPTVSITKADGKALLDQLNAGTKVTVDLDIDAVFENRTTYNVVAETKGGDHNNVIALGGHTDSVDAGPGINDNGSGMIALLNIAVALKGFTTTNAVRFLFFSAEEFGTLGSLHYVAQLNKSETELAKVRAYLNFDMIASPNYVYGILDGTGFPDEHIDPGPPGSVQLMNDFADYFTSKDLNSTSFSLDGTSDYQAFTDAGIPASGLCTGANDFKTKDDVASFGGKLDEPMDPNYHLSTDTLDKLELDAFLINTRAIAHAVAMYATSLDGIPRRETATAPETVKC